MIRDWRWNTEGVDVCPGGHEIKDGKRGGRIGYKRAVKPVKVFQMGKA